MVYCPKMSSEEVRVLQAAYDAACLARAIAKKNPQRRRAVIEITRRVEFDAGHRIPDHASKCRNAHGHRYVLEATVRGKVKMVPGASDNGMVQDFGNLKEIMNRAVADHWDHAFLVYVCDKEMISALAYLGSGHKTITFDKVPTVENLVVSAAEAIEVELPDDIELWHVRLYETPNCWADWRPTP